MGGASVAVGVSGIELFQLRQKHGRLQLRERTDVIAPMQEDTQPLLHIRMRSQEGPAPPRTQELGPTETENTDVAPGPGLAALHNCAGRLRSILDDFDF